ncbi:MAG: hypothetical protein J6B98_00505 [Bacilli bacterium]|nr:hypothetical protein [Bacilli bacterium]
MIKNVNLKGLKERASEKLKITKNGVKKGLIITGLALATTITVVSCNKKENNNTQIEQTVENIQTGAEVEIGETTENIETEEIIEQEVIAELTVEDFNKLVDEVEKSNAEAGLNLRRENLELAVYINNIDIATPELAQKIESAYDYNEEDMINTYLKVMTSYNNDKLEYYNGEDTKYADESVMFLDPIDRETIKYVDALFEELHTNSLNEENIELTMDKFNKMVDSIVAQNEQLGIEMDRRAIEISVYVRNSVAANSEVEAYINSLKLAEGETLETIDNGVLSYYKLFNANSEEQFNLSNLEYESYYLGAVVEELEGYTRENNTIKGYTKSELTVGGLFTVKLKIDDAFAYFATTGYANEYEDEIAGIAEANLEAVVARTYAELGDAAAIKDCEEDKTLNK